MKNFSGEFKGIRVLFADELEQISGGKAKEKEEEDIPTLETIIVEADDEDDYFFDYYMPLNWEFGGDSWATIEDPEPDDEASINVHVNIDRPLTENEQKALNDLTQAIIHATQVIDQIPNDAVLTMENESTISGVELKQLWSKIDFEINEKGTQYPNGLDTGQADYNNGNPYVSFNIDTIKDYNAFEGGINFLVLHELAHMTNAGRDYYQNLFNSDGVYTVEEFKQNERFANDIARAIANHGNMKILSENYAADVHGYSAGDPKSFVISNNSGGGNGGGGNSGGGGGGGRGNTSVN